MNDLLQQPEIAKATPKPMLLKEAWLPGFTSKTYLIKLSRYLLIFSFYQVLSLRSIQGSSKGLFLGAKGGNNDENHNHNDVGNFVLYLDGEPAIIDVGVATYTNRTFGKDRYKLWYMQSQWHNLPSINGVMQHEGGQYKAKNVSFKSTPNGGEFQLDIASAYPTEAHVKNWMRKLTFDGKTNEMTLKETYELSEFVKPTDMHFITTLEKVEKTELGKVEIK